MKENLMKTMQSLNEIYV